MANTADKKIYDIFIALLSAQLHTETPSVASLSDAETQALFALSAKHKLTPMIAAALAATDALDAAQNERLMRTQALAVYQHEQKELVQKRVASLFDENDIPYVLLKGALLCSMYPQPWMRPRADIDILIHNEDLRKAISLLTKQMHYTVVSENYHDITLQSKNKVTLELHFNLLERQGNLDRVLSKVWDHTTVTGDGCRLEMSREFFVFHQIAHTAYHFLNGGCGVRFIMDLWLLREYCDEKKLMPLLEQSDLCTFYDSLKKLYRYWFEGETPDDLTQQMAEFILRGALFGTGWNKIAIDQSRKGGKIGFIFDRLWWKYDDLKVQYPSLEGKRYLLPIYEVRRWLRLFKRGKAKKSVQQLKVNYSVNAQTAKQLDAFMKRVGL